MLIYKTTNLINGKIYVGKDTKNNPDYFGSGVILKKAIEKYGKENFHKEIIEYCDTYEQLNEREKYWIKELNVIDKHIGYNLTQGGDGFAHGELNPVHRDDVKQRIIQKLKINNGSFRQEVKDKIRNTLMGRTLTQEHKDSVSHGLLGHKASKGSDNPKSKEWVVIFPDGHEEQIKGLRAFCREYKLTPKLMRQTYYGIYQQHKGFILKHI